MTSGRRKATVLLATYNGEAYLAEQLDSLSRQTIGGVDVLASDDGSSDATPGILRQYAERWRRGDFAVTQGPRRGFAENFRSLLTSATGVADYVAFCDQDDVWHEDKLEAAIAVLAGYPASVPVLYGSRTRRVDATGRHLGYSPLFRRPPGFRNAIVQSIAGGNTMVMNRAAFELVAETARRTGFVSHDWWAYLVVSGAGGLVHYDRQPRIAYRQHGDNVVGDNAGIAAKMRRIQLLLQGRFAKWNDHNVSSLERCFDLLSSDASVVIEKFKNTRSSIGPRAVNELMESGIYRQTLAGSVSLAGAAMIGKL